jgi:hypothetical protein
MGNDSSPVLSTCHMWASKLLLKVANPQILVLIPLSQIRNFLRYARVCKSQIHKYLRNTQLCSVSKQSKKSSFHTIFCYVQFLIRALHAICVRRKGMYSWICGSFHTANHKKLGLQIANFAERSGNIPNLRICNGFARIYLRLHTCAICRKFRPFFEKQSYSTLGSDFNISFYPFGVMRPDFQAVAVK